jgi:hypothetical protein
LYSLRKSPEQWLRGRLPCSVEQGHDRTAAYRKKQSLEWLLLGRGEGLESAYSVEKLVAEAAIIVAILSMRLS